MHNYIYVPTCATWPGVSVNARISPVALTDPNGGPVLNENGKSVVLSASAWLDRYRPVEQMTWAPGMPLVIRDKLFLEGGSIEHRGASCFNLYLAPTIQMGNPEKAARWVEHVQLVYPTDARSHPRLVRASGSATI